MVGDMGNISLNHIQISLTQVCKEGRGPEIKKLVHLITSIMPGGPADEPVAGLDLIKPFIFAPLKDFQGQIKAMM